MPEWTTACPDWAEKIKTGKSIIPPPIFPEEAAAGVAVLEDLRIVDAPGSPRIRDACGPWIFDLASSIFGAYDAESGRRLITEWFLMIPKKNFKSGLAASIMLTTLIRNWRQSAEFTILAPTLEVANNAFNPARDMVKYEDEQDYNPLNDLIHVQTHIRTLTHLEKNATMKVIAADENTAAGKKSVGTLIEEVWLFGKRASAEAMLIEATGGLASRPEGFTIWVTTQSDEPPAGIFKQKLQYARDVRDGKIVDPSFVPILFEHPPEMVKSGEHLLLENMWMVNPNMGYSVDETFLKREYAKASAQGRQSLLGFMAKHANVEIGLNLRSDRWAGAEFWEQQGRPGLTLEQLIERSEVIEIGIDGGGLDDLLGLAVIGRDRETQGWLAWCRAWAHQIVLERRKGEETLLRDLAEEGTLILCEDFGQDIEGVVQIVAQCLASDLLDKIGVDQSGIGSIVDALTEIGVFDRIVGISQGWRMNAAIKTAERKLSERALEHEGSKLMAWCVGNAKVVPTGNAVAITKQAAGTGKIDPLMALFNAIELMSRNPAGMRSFWDKDE